MLSENQQGEKNTHTQKKQIKTKTKTRQTNYSIKPTKTLDIGINRYKI